MTEAESGIIALYGDSPRMRMIEFFMQFPKNRFSIPELIQGIGMSKTTAYNEVEKLKENGMIKQLDNIGKSPTYAINPRSALVYTMQKLVSHRSKKIADLQKVRPRSDRLNFLLRTHLEELQGREIMLKTELKLVRVTIKDRTEKEIIA